MSDLFGIHFSGSGRLIFLPLFLLLIGLTIRNYRRISKTFTQLTHRTLHSIIFPHFSRTKQLLKACCLSLSLIFLFIALMQPQWGKKEQIIVQEGRDLMVLLDVSRSMLAQDMRPNRLEFSKLKIRSLLDKLTVERLGLILFSGSAFVQCPLTADRAAFLMFLENVDAEAISSGTTSIGSALNRAVDVFANAPERKNKLILLITDGEDFSLNINEAKQRAIQDQVTLFALGVGTKQGAPIPIVDSMGKQVGHEMDGQGNVQLSALNETMLKDICKTLQGNYFKAEYQDDDLDSLVGLIKKFEKEQFTDKKLSLYEDHYPWFLGIATALLALEWIL
ncbi:VWA domain-containing protein [Candidatus Dependentiae bacterium]|nr:VWA domain-containing protein [Candidatus Dependentiae bacterium]